MGADSKNQTKKGRQSFVTTTVSSHPSAWFRAQPEVRLSAGKEVLGGWGTYLMLLASATVEGKEQVEEESLMDFVGGLRTCPGTQPSAAGEWMLAGR